MIAGLNLQDADGDDADAVVDAEDRGTYVFLYAGVMSRNEPVLLDSTEVRQLRDWLTAWLERP